MSIFSGADEASGSRTSLYIAPGKYISRINAIKTGQTRKKRDFVVIETSCLAVIREDNDSQTGQPCSNRAGTSPSHMIMMDSDTGLPNVIAAVRDICGVSDDEITEAKLTQVCSDAQPLQGWIVIINAIEITTRSGNPFTKVDYQGLAKVKDLELAGISPEDLDENDTLFEHLEG